MTVQNALNSAIDAYIQANFTGSLADVSADQLNLQTLLSIQESLLVSTGNGAGTLVLAVFKAVGAGTGYSIDDIIILQQNPPNAPEYYNATTNAVIAAPDPADLGSVSSASNVTVVGALPSGSNTIGAISNTAFTANAGTNLNTSALALESGGNLATITSTIAADGGALPTNAVLVGGHHDGTLQHLLVDGQGRVLVNPTAQQTMVDSFSVVIASDQTDVPIKAGQIQYTETQLTAPNTTTSRSMAGYNKAMIQVTVASINTSVTIRIEGSNDGTNWGNLSASNSDTVISANGTTLFQYQGNPQFIRTNFVSESGGTAATVDVVTRLSA